MVDDEAAAAPHLTTIAVVSNQCLVWLGLQKVLESSTILPLVVHPYPGRTSELLHAECRPDVFIVDVETERDILGTLTKIRESAPTSKIVLLCGLDEKDRMREAFAAGVDGVILKVQPPEVMLAVIESLYASGKSQAPGERDGAIKMGLAPPSSCR